MFILWSVREVTQRVPPTCIIKTSRTVLQLQLRLHGQRNPAGGYPVHPQRTVHRFHVRAIQRNGKRRVIVARMHDVPLRHKGEIGVVKLQRISPLYDIQHRHRMGEHGHKHGGVGGDDLHGQRVQPCRSCDGQTHGRPHTPQLFGQPFNGRGVGAAGMHVGGGRGEFQPDGMIGGGSSAGDIGKRGKTVLQRPRRRSHPPWFLFARHRVHQRQVDVTCRVGGVGNPVASVVGHLYGDRPAHRVLRRYLDRWHRHHMLDASWNTS
jgi:hypothetical protein